MLSQMQTEVHLLRQKELHKTADNERLVRHHRLQNTLQWLSLKLSDDVNKK